AGGTRRRPVAAADPAPADTAGAKNGDGERESRSADAAAEGRGDALRLVHQHRAGGRGPTACARPADERPARGRGCDESDRRVRREVRGADVRPAAAVDRAGPAAAVAVPDNV